MVRHGLSLHYPEYGSAICFFHNRGPSPITASVMFRLPTRCLELQALRLLLNVRDGRPCPRSSAERLNHGRAVSVDEDLTKTVANSTLQHDAAVCYGFAKGLEALRQRLHDCRYPFMNA